jgi:hypothetical protein
MDARQRRAALPRQTRRRVFRNPPAQRFAGDEIHDEAGAHAVIGGQHMADGRHRHARLGRRAHDARLLRQTDPGPRRRHATRCAPHDQLFTPCAGHHVERPDFLHGAARKPPQPLDADRKRVQPARQRMQPGLKQIAAGHDPSLSRRVLPGTPERGGRGARESSAANAGRYRAANGSSPHVSQASNTPSCPAPRPPPPSPRSPPRSAVRYRRPWRQCPAS